MADVPDDSKKCTGSTAHLVLDPELHDYSWNYEGNLMKPVPKTFERMNPKQTHSTLKGAGVNEIWGDSTPIN